MMRNSMKLRVALAMSMLISPLYAGQKIGYAQKAVKVAVHSITVGAGIFCGYTSGQAFLGALDSYKKCLSNSQTGYCSPFQEKLDKDALKANLKAGLGLSGVSSCLFYSGLSGIDRELLVRQRVKQLLAKLMGKIRGFSKK